MQIAATQYPAYTRVQSVATPAAAQATAQAASKPPAAASFSASAISADVADMIPNQDHLARFNRIGLTTPGRLSFWTAGAFRRFLVSALTGISQQDLVRYGQRADLMRIPEMRGKTAYILENMGIKGPADLAQYRGDDFAIKVQRGVLYATVVAKAIELSANEGRVYEAPSLSQLERLIENSVGLGNRIQP